MNREYTREEIIQWLRSYFDQEGYDVMLYSDEFLPARVPLYCKKEEGDQRDELVVELTTNSAISKNDWFPTLTIGDLDVLEASSVKFFQYYFPWARIFLAYPDYVQEDEGFEEFKKVCEKRGIGLLKTSQTETKEILQSRPLFNEVCQALAAKKDSPKDIRVAIGNYFESFIHYLVYYPDPIYRRRAIIGKTEKMISFVMIDRLSELKNLAYKEELQNMAREFRQTGKDDYDVAEECTACLWREYLGMEYPNIQRRVESILQRDEVYREHFVHQFQVFLIGAYILDNVYPKIAKVFGQKHKCKIEEVWLAASTFHDFSYGLQNFDIWLLQFFVDTLRIKNSQTKENINLLNLDSAMIREALFEKIVEMTKQLFGDLEENRKDVVMRFFYEKTVRDRNHGVLSAISLLKLYDDTPEGNRKISKKGILEAAVAIGYHDEDVWESLCGCKGYRRSHIDLPADETTCAKDCSRESLLWSSKKSRIFKESLSSDSRCESWEREFMKQRMMSKITFEDNPILFLLAFCDSVQDEGRITSSDNGGKGDRSSLTDIIIDQATINVRLRSDEANEKEREIERLAWCLNDDRFRISINDTTKKMNGSGG